MFLVKCPMHNSTYNFMQLKLGDLLNISSLPKEIKMCRISTSNVSCDSGEMVSGASGGEFARECDNSSIQNTIV